MALSIRSGVHDHCLCRDIWLGSALIEHVKQYDSLEMHITQVYQRCNYIIYVECDI